MRASPSLSRNSDASVQFFGPTKGIFLARIGDCCPRRLGIRYSRSSIKIGHRRSPGDRLGKGNMSYIPNTSPEYALPERFILNAATGDRESCRGTEQRQERRFVTNEFAFIQSLKPLVSERIPVRVLDVSKGGLGLRLNCSFEPGTVVQVKMRDLFVLGEVRHCRPEASSFVAGVRIENVLEFVSTRTPSFRTSSLPQGLRRSQPQPAHPPQARYSVRTSCRYRTGC
jgi:PilZ domain